ncbi:MAG: YigZ family protein [Mogibacterium sp.]|nr:YigZ family protein [Mogibacterium sp.]
MEKSRFIAHAMPVESFEAAKAYAAEIKAEYRDATHNVPAIVCGSGQEYQWASDDGEPSGTSGLPVLKLISSEGLTNIAVVVTRYFGGIKLGTGGLARAYTAAAKLGIEAAGVCEVMESRLLTYRFDYSYLTKLQNLAGEGRFEISDTEYSDTVKAGISCLSEDAEDIKELMNNLTNGQAVFLEELCNTIKIKKSR